MEAIKTKAKTTKVYSFSWIDENGHPAGWNEVQTTSGIVEARKLAKAKQSPARDFTYGVYEADGSTGQRVERFTGLFVDWKSFKRVSIEQSMEDHRQADIRSR
jgi:hypothetical protein